MNTLKKPLKNISHLVMLGLLSSPAFALPIVTVADLGGNLGFVNLDDGTVESIVGFLGQPFRGLAYSPDNHLYGITPTDLYRIDPNTAATTLIGPLGFDNATGITFTPSGILYVTSVTDSQLYQVDPFTANSLPIVDTGFFTLGDIAFFDNDLYMTTNTYQLVNIDLDNVTDINPHGYVPPIYGLIDGQDGWLYGFYRQEAFQIDPQNGQYSVISNWQSQGLEQSLAATYPFPRVTVPVPNTFLLFLLGIIGFGTWIKVRRKV